MRDIVLQNKMNGVINKKVGIMGLGHVGLPLGLTLADRGICVYGFDVNKKVIESLKKGVPHFQEHGLSNLLSKNNHKNFFVKDFLGEDSKCDMYIITVGTPIDTDRKPDFGYIKKVAADVGKVIKKGDLIILRSTVPLGTSRDVVLPILEKQSGLKGGSDIHISFAPERTIEGNALEELKKLPQIIGGLDEKSTHLTKELFSVIVENIILVGSLEEAEMVKLINNSYREAVFSFANEMALIAKRWGINTSRVIKASNKDYPRGGVPLPSPGVGGYCLTKDSSILIESAERKGVLPKFIYQARYVNSFILDLMAEEIKNFIDDKLSRSKKIKVAVLGFAFKGNPPTSDVRGSTTIALLKRLRNLPFDFEIFGYDPVVSHEKISETGVTPAHSLSEAIKNSNIVIIMNNNPVFSKITPELFLDDEPVLFYDTWGMTQNESFKDKKTLYFYTL